MTKLKLVTAASLACLLSACGGLSPESIICSQDPEGCSDDDITGGGERPPAITIVTDHAVYNALAGSYSASGTATLRMIQRTGDRIEGETDNNINYVRTGSVDTEAETQATSMNVAATTDATWTMNIDINSAGLAISGSSLDLDEANSALIVSDDIDMDTQRTLVYNDGQNNFLNVALKGDVTHVDMEADETGQTNTTVDLATTTSFMHLKADTQITGQDPDTGQITAATLNDITSDGNANTLDIFIALPSAVDPSDYKWGLGAFDYQTD